MFFIWLPTDSQRAASTAANGRIFVPTPFRRRPCARLYPRPGAFFSGCRLLAPRRQFSFPPRGHRPRRKRLPPPPDPSFLTVSPRRRRVRCPRVLAPAFFSFRRRRRIKIDCRPFSLVFYHSPETLCRRIDARFGIRKSGFPHFVLFEERFRLFPDGLCTHSAAR